MVAPGHICLLVFVKTELDVYKSVVKLRYKASLAFTVIVGVFIVSKLVCGLSPVVGRKIGLIGLEILILGVRELC